MNFVFCAELDSVRPPTQILFFLYFQGEVQALFLRHEGYLGAIGAFLKGAEEDSKEKLQIQIILLNLLSTWPLYV